MIIFDDVLIPKNGFNTWTLFCTDQDTQENKLTLKHPSCLQIHLPDAKLEAVSFCFTRGWSTSPPSLFFSEDDEGDSSDEDVPFKDDLNDQSYDPKSGRCVCVCDDQEVHILKNNNNNNNRHHWCASCRESQKPRRRAAPRPREKKEKAAGGEKDKKETEVKTEGVEMADVKQEVGEGAEPPRKWVTF